MKISIGSDHGGFQLKEKIVAFLRKKGFEILDFGTDSPESCDYPLIAYEVAKSVSKKKADKGILVCKTGIGNSIAANKVKGIRAALCYNIKAAELSRRHNDSNVLVLGALFADIAKAKDIINVWLKTKFEGGRHARRVKQIERIEKYV